MTRSSVRVLDQIAEVLGLPVDRFYADAERRGPLSEQAELLLLWDRIDTDAGRLSVLAFARKAAAAAN